MSEEHLKELRAELTRNEWRIVEELPGDAHGVSGVWRIARVDGPLLHLVFEGMGDSSAQPMQRAYSCRVREAPKVNVYFARLSRSWNKNRDAFFVQLNALAQQ